MIACEKEYTLINQVDYPRDEQDVALPPSLFIIILNWNQWQLTTDCLQSLQQVNHPNLHLVVIDNGSSDDSVARLKACVGHRTTLLCNTENLGFAGGNNVGIQYALSQKAASIMLLNNDTLVAKDFLEPLVNCFYQDPQIGIVTPKIYFMEPSSNIWAAGGFINSWSGKAGSLGRGQQDKGQFDKPGTVDYATGCCLLARAEVFNSAGLLDENFFAYFEDADWCIRVKKLGWLVWYEPRSIIWHWAGASSKSKSSNRDGNTSPFVYYLGIRNNLWFLRRHFSGIRLLTAITLLMFRHVIYYSAAFIALRRWAKLKMLWRGVIDGFRNTIPNPTALMTTRIKADLK